MSPYGTGLEVPTNTLCNVFFVQKFKLIKTYIKISLFCEEKNCKNSPITKGSASKTHWLQAAEASSF